MSMGVFRHPDCEGRAENRYFDRYIDFGVENDVEIDVNEALSLMSEGYDAWSSARALPVQCNLLAGTEVLQSK